MKVGFIGVGNMGGPMCRNIIRKSGEQVIVFDLSADATLYETALRDIYSLGTYLYRKKFRYLRMAYVALLTGFILATVVDECVLFTTKRGVTLGRFIEHQPEHKPDKSESTGNQEGRLPAKTYLQKNDQWRRNDVADGYTAVENSHGECALAYRKPFGYYLRCARPITSLSNTEQ